MDVLRTPDQRFAGLLTLRSPHYRGSQRRGPPLRIHYLDEGDASSPVLLLPRLADLVLPTGT